jgi:hypothetical protein
VDAGLWLEPPVARCVRGIGSGGDTPYSTYARGPDGLWGMFQWLDRAPKGRNETSAW